VRDEVVRRTGDGFALGSRGGMTLDRRSIVRPFPTVRRGYDPTAVDAHLAAVADEAEAAAPSSTLSAQSADQVRAIVEAAETSAARIRADAEREARERLAHAADAADRLVAAVDRLHGEAERLQAELSGLRTEAAAAPQAPAPAAAPAEPVAEPARSDDEAAARIVALDLALAGTPRDEADRRLAEAYELPDRAALLDEVYAAAGA
jgi:DivIVA domain-containing protein